MADSLRDLVARELAEDLGSGDVTSDAVVPADARARARIVQKEPGVLFGLDAAAEAFTQAGSESFDRLMVEGQWRDEAPAEVAIVGGPARALLAAERTALNLLCHLSGVATLTAKFVEAVRGTGAQILDTRKTTPGLRALEKAAVAAGGGVNHRMGLDDAILIKENHLALAGGVEEAVRRAREAVAGLEVEVECRSAAEVEQALSAGADRLLLDNMTPTGLQAAVAARDAVVSKAKLEASGGITLDNVAEIAATGVDFISVGALTHSAPALDLSMIVEATGSTAGPSPMERPDREAFEEIVEAYERDPWSTGRYLADDVELVVHRDVGYADAGVFHGRGEVERWFARWLSAWDELTMEVQELVEVRDWLVSINQLRARGKESGVPVERVWTSAYRIENGELVEMRFFRDKDAALRELGAEP